MKNSEDKKIEDIATWVWAILFSALPVLLILGFWVDYPLIFVVIVIYVLAFFGYLGWKDNKVREIETKERLKEKYGIDV